MTPRSISIMAALAAASIAALTVPAEARHLQVHHKTAGHADFSRLTIDVAASPAYPTVAGIPTTVYNGYPSAGRRARSHSAAAYRTRRHTARSSLASHEPRQADSGAGGGNGVIGGRPAGCPRQYCGCGARLYLGISDKRLDLAWNWTRYYRGSTPVAVWPHHIAIIVRMTGPRTAVVRDYNGGRGLSYIHERDISRARIVSGSQLAMR